jgi:hypothetical protein
MTATTAYPHSNTGANSADVNATALGRARRGKSNDDDVPALLKLSNIVAEKSGIVDDVDLTNCPRAGRD